jgi:hypothetical protein
MKRLYLLFFLLVASFFKVSGQASCTQVLRSANDTYNAGRLHELPKLVEGCINGRSDGDKFSQTELVTAYKLLSQAYIYLEEPEEANKAMHNLLKTDGFFEINENLDPAEFVALYNKFRTRPVISLVTKFGLTYTFVSPNTLFKAGSGDYGNGNFSPALGLYYGLGAEKIISGKLKKHKITFAPEVFLMNKTFTFQDPTVFNSDADQTQSVTKIKSTFTQKRIDFYPIFQFELFRKSSLNPFVGIGPGISFLSSAANENITARNDLNGNSTTTISGSLINTTNSFTKLTYSAIAMAGVKLRIGPMFVTADIRFQYGFSNITKTARTNNESLFDYGYQFDNMKTTNVMGTVGVIYPIFIPKKLIK